MPGESKEIVQEKERARESKRERERRGRAAWHFTRRNKSDYLDDEGVCVELGDTLNTRVCEWMSECVCVCIVWE